MIQPYRVTTMMPRSNPNSNDGSHDYGETTSSHQDAAVILATAMAHGQLLGGGGGYDSLTQPATPKHAAFPNLESPMVTPPSVHVRSTHAGNDDVKPKGVPHVYHDYAKLPSEPIHVRKKTGGVTQPFPEKLHEMLQAESSNTANNIVSWLPHGRAFLVQQPKLFTSEIMPKYFRQTKLTSFQRQLNLYGFRRITQGPDAGAYYHEMFLQHRSSLSQRMQRQKVKGTGHKQPADASSEPNFYHMPPVMHDDDAAAESSPTRLLVAPASPGLQSVHGAAHLLQNIATGFSFQNANHHGLLGPASLPSNRHGGSRNMNFLQPSQLDQV